MSLKKRTMNSTLLSQKTGIKPCYIEEMIKENKYEEFLFFHEYMKNKIQISYRNCASNASKPLSPDALMRLAVYGFGDVNYRIQLFDIFRNVFHTQWHFASEPNPKAPNRWEMLIVFRQSSNITMEDMDNFSNFLKLSISFDDIGSKVDEALLTFVNRIDKGTKQSGYLRHKLRSRLNEFKVKVEEKEGRQRVLETTGRPLTSGNTLHYFYEMNNAIADSNRYKALYESMKDRFNKEICAHVATKRSCLEILTSLQRIHIILGQQITVLQGVHDTLFTFRDYHTLICRIQRIMEDPSHHILTEPSTSETQVEILLKNIEACISHMQERISDPSVASLKDRLERELETLKTSSVNLTRQMQDIDGIINTSSETLRNIYLIY